MDRRLLALATLASLTAACAHAPAEQPRVVLGPGYQTSTAAAAAPAPLAAPEITRFADANNDGKVTREEASADPALAKSFDQYDLNKDEVLDRGEFARLEDTRLRAAPVRRATADGWTLSEPSGLPPPAAQDAQVESDPSLNRTGVSRSYRAIRN